MIAYTMLVGKPPYWEKRLRRWSAARVVAAGQPQLAVNGAKEKASRRAGEVGVALPREFDRWFKRMTASAIEDRYASATEAIGDLAALLGITPAPASLTGRDLANHGSGPVPAGLASSLANPPRAMVRARARVWAFVGLAAGCAVILVPALWWSARATPAAVQSGQAPAASVASASPDAAPVAVDSPPRDSAELAEIAPASATAGVKTPPHAAADMPAPGTGRARVQAGNPSARTSARDAGTVPPVATSRYTRE